MAILCEPGIGRGIQYYTQTHPPPPQITPHPPRIDLIYTFIRLEGMRQHFGHLF